MRQLNVMMDCPFPAQAGTQVYSVRGEKLVPPPVRGRGSAIPVEHIQVRINKTAEVPTGEPDPDSVLLECAGTEGVACSLRPGSEDERRTRTRQESASHENPVRPGISDTVLHPRPGCGHLPPPW